ncbi:MAG TPA: serine/threonine-protein kinase, partial [Polyangia bacterium]|nr:serine/threonine-protein kinase [Polyangia bacterium]
MSHDDPVTAVGRLPRAKAATATTADDADNVPWFEGSVDTWENQRPPGSPPPTPSAAPPSLRGKDRLRDEGEIARGGMGSIRRLYDTELLRHIAMKVLDNELAMQPESKERFLDEARITGQLDHPNIVPVHELVLDARGVPSYFTMKLVDGETLTRLIAAQKTQRDLERLLEILVKVCDAMAFAHSRGIIHRDLKPDNIMVGSFGQVYVMDWGCAHVSDTERSAIARRADPEGTVIGTVQYMAPEQAWGQIQKIDQRTDVFAIGGILYKMLTGSPPYPGPIPEALPLAQQRRLKPPEE